MAQFEADGDQIRSADRNRSIQKVKYRFIGVDFTQINQPAGASSRAELISSNNAVVSGFALTRAVMAVVILATILLGGGTHASSIFIVQAIAAVASVVALSLSVHTVVKRPAARVLYAERPWAFILLDSLLAVGVMSMLDAESSPFAWVALITPVLETAVVFSMASAGFVWLGLSLAFLAVRLATNTCLLYTSPSPRDQRGSRMPSSA